MYFFFCSNKTLQQKRKRFYKNDHEKLSLKKKIRSLSRYNTMTAKIFFCLTVYLMSYHVIWKSNILISIILKSINFSIKHLFTFFRSVWSSFYRLLRSLFTSSTLQGKHFFLFLLKPTVSR